MVLERKLPRFFESELIDFLLQGFPFFPDECPLLFTLLPVVLAIRFQLPFGALLSINCVFNRLRHQSKQRRLLRQHLPKFPKPPNHPLRPAKRSGPPACS